MSDLVGERSKFPRRSLPGILALLTASSVAVAYGADKYTEYLDARRIAAELSENAEMTDDQKEDKIRELHKLQKSLGWEYLISSGLPEETFNSACRIGVFDQTLSEGSASVLTLSKNERNYRVIPSAGHVLSIITDNCLGVGIYRHEEMGQKTKNVLRRNQFGLSYVDKDGTYNTEEDFGFLIIEEDVAISTGIADVYNRESTGSVDDILFNDLRDSETGLYAIGFPGLLGVAPLAYMDGSLKKFEQSETKNNISIDGFFGYGGVSGAMVYLNRNFGRAKLVGTMYSHFDVSNALPNDNNVKYWDNANVFPISTLGKERFNLMVESAINDLEGRKNI